MRNLDRVLIMAVAVVARLSLVRDLVHHGLGLLVLVKSVHASD